MRLDGKVLMRASVKNARHQKADFMYSIVLDKAKCKVCGECVDICSNGIYSKEDDQIVIGRTEECTGCQNCASVCVNEALTVTEV